LQYDFGYSIATLIQEQTEQGRNDVWAIPKDNIASAVWVSEFQPSCLGVRLLRAKGLRVQRLRQRNLRSAAMSFRPTFRWEASEPQYPHSAVLDARD
jgi:hypothetical protein